MKMHLVGINRIIIDGKGTVLNGNTDIPLDLYDCSDIIIKDFVFLGSPADVVRIRSSRNIILSCILAQPTQESLDIKGFNIIDCSDVLIKDCASWGMCRKNFQVYRSTGVRFHCCYGRWDSSVLTSPKCVYAPCYNSVGTQMDYCIGEMVKVPSTTQYGVWYSDNNHLIGDVPCETTVRSCLAVCPSSVPGFVSGWNQPDYINCAIGLNNEPVDFPSLSYVWRFSPLVKRLRKYADIDVMSYFV